MTDPAVPLLLDQVSVCTVSVIVQIMVDVHLAHIVEQVEIKIVHLAFLQLFLKNLFHLAKVGEVVSRELRRQIKILPRIFLQRLAHDCLGMSVVISPCSVIIIDPMLHRIADQFVRSCGIDL